LVTQALLGRFDDIIATDHDLGCALGLDDLVLVCGANATSTRQAPTGTGLWLLTLRHEPERGGAVRAMSPRPSEGASRVIDRRHKPTPSL
jgi:hypothetical protein